MFTGLVEAMGEVASRDGARLVVRAPFAGELALGESVSIGGVCLTVVSLEGGGAAGFDVSPESYARTTLGGLAAGSRVNLERAMPLGGRMGGHLVTGHVDAVGEVVSRRDIGDGAVEIVFAFPVEIGRFIAPKGSIAVDGVSLTVNGAARDRFDVVVIPHTRAVTTLDLLAAGSRVNLEVDLVARYVLRSAEYK